MRQKPQANEKNLLALIDDTTVNEDVVTTAVVESSQETSERRCIGQLCAVNDGVHEGVQIYPVPIHHIRAITVQEGQRPINKEKVKKITSQLLTNPHVTVGAHSLLCFNRALDFDAVIHFLKNAFTLEETEDKFFGTIGGNHFITGFNAALAACPDLPRAK